jgi:AcrR family transcriptional regulator
MEKQEENIIRGSLDLFIRLGVKSVTMDDVSRELGVSKKTVYKYVSNKAELVDKSFTWLAQNIHDIMAHIHSQERHPIDEMFDMDNVICDVFRNQHPGIAFQLRKYYPETWQKIENFRQEMFIHFIADNMKRGVELGLYRKNLNVELVAEVYFAKAEMMVEGTVMEKLNLSIYEFTMQNLEYHLRGICNGEGLQYLDRKLKEKQNQ